MGSVLYQPVVPSRHFGDPASTSTRQESVCPSPPATVVPACHLPSLFMSYSAIHSTCLCRNPLLVDGTSPPCVCMGWPRTQASPDYLPSYLGDFILHPCPARVRAEERVRRGTSLRHTEPHFDEAIPSPLPNGRYQLAHAGTWQSPRCNQVLGKPSRFKTPAILASIRKSGWAERGNRTGSAPPTSAERSSPQRARRWPAGIHRRPLWRHHRSSAEEMPLMEG